MNPFCTRITTMTQDTLSLRDMAQYLPKSVNMHAQYYGKVLTVFSQ